MKKTFGGASAGNAIRLRRIFHPKTGRTLIIPLDHVAADGLLPGLADSRRILNNAAEAGVDAVMLRPGLMDAVVETDTRALGIIVMLTGRLSRGHDHVLLNTVEHAARCGADAVCAEFKLGSTGELENVRIVSTVAEAARQQGLPILMTSYALKEYVEKVGPSAYAQACRICEELGADIIKTSLPSDKTTIELCLSATRVPILLAGGVSRQDENLMTRVAAAVELGVAGAAVGRQIWGSEDPVGVARQLRRIIHGNAGI